MENSVFQQRLRELRAEQGLTQGALAALLHTSDDSVYSWEKGRSEPSLSMLTEICRVFNVSADYLLGLEDESGAKRYR